VGVHRRGGAGGGSSGAGGRVEEASRPGSANLRTPLSRVVVDSTHRDFEEMRRAVEDAATAAIEKKERIKELLVGQGSAR